ncbi:DNA-binding transcriptional regulator, MarR family [Thermomonospora echinospora]|uniref:DNA-binding transcriptional regulator, MarR family n=1 Tax=Thermomonospora echinospora TaxID=1992 RepID=A0A1H6CUZ0_9ACTN|nr:MarR family transcriptional regulator [Thermomonospora echinospora]SEG76335.1 DNA-binding transcriptional regulator, MarR family [Thermomonospora echinospora]
MGQRDVGEPGKADLGTALRASPGYLLRRVFVLFTGEAMRDGPHSRDFVVLDVLADQDATSQQELAERLGINRTIMVRLIDRLQDAGYVTRTRNPANRRTHVLSLTEDGHGALDEMRREMSDRDARITAPLTPDERLRLNELLNELLPEPGRPPVQSTEYLVAQAHYRLRRLGDGLLADVGLRTRHFSPLAALQQLAPCPQQRLADALAITEPAAAQVVDELVQAGLVVRGRDPHDRRRYALELTDLGRQRLPVVHDAARRLRAEVVDLLGAEAEQELRALLTKLLPTEDDRPTSD